MDPTETLVRKRFEAAVGDVNLDAVSLVGAGIVAGRRMRRTRRIQQGIGAVAGLAVIAAAGLVGLNGGWFDNNSAPPAKPGPITEMVPSNPRAMAAAVIAKFPTGWKIQGVQEIAPPPHEKALSDDFTVSVSGQLMSVRVTVYKLQPFKLNCAGRHDHRTCIMVDLPGGGRLRLETIPASSGNPFNSVMAFAMRSDVIVSVEMQQMSPGKPGQAAGLTRVTKAITIFPAVGFQTYQHYVDIEGTVPHFKPLKPTPTPHA